MSLAEGFWWLEQETAVIVQIQRRVVLVFEVMMTNMVENRTPIQKILTMTQGGCES